MPLELTRLSGDVSVARLDRVVLAHFRGRTPASCAADLRKAAPATGQFAFFAVIEEASEPPDEEARRALSKFFSESAASLSVFVLTHEREGFRGAALRAVVSGILDLMPGFRLGFPKHVVGSLDEAARLVHRHDARVDAGALLMAFRELAAMKP